MAPRKEGNMIKRGNSKRAVQAMERHEQRSADLKAKADAVIASG